MGDIVVVGSADWLEKILREHNIAHQPGTVDIGVTKINEVMETVKKVSLPV